MSVTDCGKQKSKREELVHIVKPLLNWFYGHARILPWREEPTAYRVWISEIMLQQTRVEAVKPYFERFLKELPTMDALCHAKEEVLLKLWEGLGYYNRARNLQKAARLVCEQYQGELPKDYEELLRLPGIGPYTAGAVASIAYQMKIPAVDGNVLRVITRVTGDDSDIVKQSVRSEMSGNLLEIMPEELPGDFNQALMELGALICLPNGLPKCSECPLQDMCRACKEGTTEVLPRKSGKKPRVIEEKTVLIIQDDEKTALYRRPETGLLAGLYEFPNIEGCITMEEALEFVKEKGLSPIFIKKIENSKHIFSHKEWHMSAYAVKIETVGIKEKESCDSGIIFADKEETERRYTIPAAFATYAKYLDIKIGNEKFEGVIKL